MALVKNLRIEFDAIVIVEWGCVARKNKRSIVLVASFLTINSDYHS